jgi:hypothetical protein
MLLDDGFESFGEGNNHLSGHTPDLPDDSEHLGLDGHHFPGRQEGVTAGNLFQQGSRLVLIEVYEPGKIVEAEGDVKRPGNALGKQ